MLLTTGNVINCNTELNNAMEEYRQNQVLCEKLYVEFRDICQFKIINTATKYEYLTDSYTLDNNNSLIFKDFIVLSRPYKSAEPNLVKNRQMLFSSGSYIVERLKYE
jgi:hypothetical protein